MNAAQSLVGWLCLVYGTLASARAIQVLVGGEGDGVVLMGVLGVSMSGAGVALIRAGRHEGPARLAPGDMEPAILRVARDAGGRVVVLEVAAAMDAPIERVEAALLQLRDRQICEELVSEAGVSVFRFPALENLTGGKRDLLEGDPPPTLPRTS